MICYTTETIFDDFINEEIQVRFFAEVDWVDKTAIIDSLSFVPKTLPPFVIEVEEIYYDEIFFDERENKLIRTWMNDNCDNLLDKLIQFFKLKTGKQP